MLEIKNLSKTYEAGSKEALKDVSFSIRKGEFVALLGRNGAGKSTLINILAGNVKKSAGEISIGGFDLDKNELATKRLFGVVPQEVTFDYVFTAGEVLKNQSGYFGIKNNDTYINELLTSLSLSEKKNVKPRELSGGMKRRLLIAKALVHRPDLLILDEPTAGVDISLRHSLYEYLKQLHSQGTTIILTTHYLEEAEKLCDRIIVINEGRMIVDESKDKLLNTTGAETSMEFHFDSDLNNVDFSFLSDYSPRIEGKSTLHLMALKHQIGDVFQKITAEKMQYSDFKMESRKLEDVFLHLVRH